MISIKAKVCKDWWSKTRGLIGAAKPYPIYFHTRWGVHTFGLKFPIDVLILDEDFRVVKTVSNLTPNKLFFWPVKYYRVLEMPGGEIQRQKIKVGDKVTLDD